MFIKTQAGISFVEMILSLVIVSITFTGALQIFGTLLNWSTYPFIEKQAIAIAQTVLNDVEQGRMSVQENQDISELLPFYRDATQNHFILQLSSKPVVIQDKALQLWELTLQHNQGDEFAFSRLLRQ
jgi:Tfp pilus assembly protein PilV